MVHADMAALTQSPVCTAAVAASPGIRYFVNDHEKPETNKKKERKLPVVHKNYNDPTKQQPNLEFLRIKQVIFLGEAKCLLQKHIFHIRKYIRLGLNVYGICGCLCLMTRSIMFGLMIFFFTLINTFAVRNLEFPQIPTCVHDAGPDVKSERLARSRPD